MNFIRSRAHAMHMWRTQRRRDRATGAAPGFVARATRQLPERKLAVQVRRGDRPRTGLRQAQRGVGRTRNARTRPRSSRLSTGPDRAVVVRHQVVARLARRHRCRMPHPVRESSAISDWTTRSRRVTHEFPSSGGRFDVRTRVRTPAAVQRQRVSCESSSHQKRSASNAAQTDFGLRSVVATARRSERSTCTSRDASPRGAVRRVALYPLPR